MTKHLGMAVALCAGVSVPALAAPSRIEISTDYTRFSGANGHRRISSAELTAGLGDTKFVGSIAQGERKYGPEKFSGSRLSGTVTHEWTDRLSTSTSLSVATNDPVFPRLQASQDVHMTVAPGAVLTVGAKHLRYFGGVKANAASAGGSWYFPRGHISYRFTAFDVEQLGSTNAHLLGVRLNDSRGRGYTQAWAGSGSTLTDADWLPQGHEGRVRTVALRRVQPVSAPVSLSVGAGRSWYDAPAGDFRGTNLTLGLVFTY